MISSLRDLQIFQEKIFDIFKILVNLSVVTGLKSWTPILFNTPLSKDNIALSFSIKPVLDNTGLKIEELWYKAVNSFFSNLLK